MIIITTVVKIYDNDDNSVSDNSDENNWSTENENNNCWNNSNNICNNSNKRLTDTFNIWNIIDNQHVIKYFLPVL